MHKGSAELLFLKISLWYPMDTQHDIGKISIGYHEKFWRKKKRVDVLRRKMLVGGAIPFFNMLHHLLGIGRFHLTMCAPYTLKKNPPKVYNCRNDFNKVRNARNAWLTWREKKPNKKKHTHTHTYVHTYTLEIGIVLFCFQTSSWKGKGKHGQNEETPF